MREKILGYVLLGVGLALIVFSAVSVYSVFTGRTRPFELFRFAGISFSPNQLLIQSLSPEAQDVVDQEQLSGQSSELIAADVLNQPTNTVAHVVLMGFVAMVGFRIASIGTMLVRPIVVRLKGKAVEIDNTPEKPSTRPSWK